MGSYGCAQENCSCPCHLQHNECHHGAHHHHCCHHGDHCHGEEMKENYFLGLADKAWEEVLKEKIKKHILDTQNDRMDNLAKIISEGNMQRWKNRMEKKQAQKDFAEEICKYFGHSKN